MISPSANFAARANGVAPMRWSPITGRCCDGVPLSLGAGVGTGHASCLQTNASVKSVKHVVGAKHKKISLFHRSIRWQNKENTT